MSILIFRTNIETMGMVNRMSWVFNEHPMIHSWFVDIEDIDNVLRIEASNKLLLLEVIQLCQTHGFECEELPD